MRSSRVWMRSSRVWMWYSRAEWLERLTANAVVATVLGSIPASSDTVGSEGRQMKQWWILYMKKKKNPEKIPLKKKSFIYSTYLKLIMLLFTWNSSFKTCLKYRSLQNCQVNICIPVWRVAGRQAGRQAVFPGLPINIPLVDQILVAQAADSDNPQDTKRERQNCDEIKLFFSIFLLTEFLQSAHCKWNSSCRCTEWIGESPRVGLGTYKKTTLFSVVGCVPPPPGQLTQP